MRKKNFIMTGCIAALSLAMLAGCAKSSSSTENKSATESSKNSGGQSQDKGSDDKKGEKPQDDGSKMVQVSKVDGDTITATVGEDMRGGKPPEGKGADGKGGNASDDKQAPPEQPEGEAPQGDDSSGDTSSQKDKGDKKGGMPFQATDETMTFKITSDTKITTGGRDNQKEASSEDIKENSVLRVIVNDSNEAQSIEIMGGGTNS